MKAHGRLVLVAQMVSSIECREIFLLQVLSVKNRTIVHVTTNLYCLFNNNIIHVKFSNNKGTPRTQKMEKSFGNRTFNLPLI